MAVVSAPKSLSIPQNMEAKPKRGCLTPNVYTLSLRQRTRSVLRFGKHHDFVLEKSRKPNDSHVVHHQNTGDQMKEISIHIYFDDDMFLTKNAPHHHHATTAITKHQPQQAIIVKSEQAEESTIITSNTNSDNKTIQDTSLMQNKSWMFALAGAFRSCHVLVFASLRHIHYGFPMIPPLKSTFPV